MRPLALLPWPLVILWCYVVWWAVMVGRHFDPSPALWLSACGIAAIVGCALILATWPAGQPLRWHPRLVSWTTARLFLMPFAVSSFSATIKGQGFVLICSPRLGENLLAFGLIAGLVALRLQAGWLATRAAPLPGRVADVRYAGLAPVRTEGQAPA